MEFCLVTVRRIRLWSAESAEAIRPVQPSPSRVPSSPRMHVKQGWRCHRLWGLGSLMERLLKISSLKSCLTKPCSQNSFIIVYSINFICLWKAIELCCHNRGPLKPSLCSPAVLYYICCILYIHIVYQVKLKMSCFIYLNWRLEH